MASSSRRNRNRTFAAIGGAIALAGLGYYAFTTFTSGNDSKKDNGPGSSILSKKKGPRPSLSLSIPPTFTHSPANLRLLESLLTTLSANYVITLILPPVGTSNTSDFNHDSLDRISDLFGHIEGFDARRVLEYGKEEGRLSLARALACDAHCEVMFETFETNDTNADLALFDDEMDEDNDTVDGDKTPRASSPVPHLRSSINGNTLTASAQSIQDDQHLSSALEKYHAEVARIRKSSGLLIFLVLPIAKIKSRSHTNGNAHSNGMAPVDTGIWSLKAESILKPFLMAGQSDLSARVPGVKIIDGRIAEQKPQKKQSNKPQQNASIPKAWTDAAQRLAHLSSGWS
ncbi:uncharacterized protein FA14DRAFT_65170 [Meira miltonrushii]|uniref:Uncharacterized protein n=1 Tax=Meira miltonrushii TaxID=1280837 RepID=A0A316V824_9BASI|nr:uncharacterized protein FA14DRAFT_65170 [Meira miltonrushii]PWN33767.1 hypothetical protein FA14DRAFT_65170 [Meira miltonrushii]